ncbi:MAG: 7TMR-DISMED2 domain-containing protein, partial [Spongiibacteraceae bacterium]
MDSAASKNIRLEQVPETIDLRLYSDILILDEPKSNFADILSPQINTQFRPLELGDLNLLAQHRQYWLRFRISNSSNTAIFRQLQLSPADAQDIALHDMSIQGEGVLLAPQLSTHKRAIYEVMLPPHSSSDIYLRLNNAATQQISATLFSTPKLLKNIADREFETGLFYGFLLALLVSNAMGILVYREPLFLVMGLTCGITLVSHMLIWDYASQKTLPLLWIKPVLAIGSLSLITLMLLY